MIESREVKLNKKLIQWNTCNFGESSFFGNKHFPFILLYDLIFHRASLQVLGKHLMSLHLRFPF